MANSSSSAPSSVWAQRGRSLSIVVALALFSTLLAAALRGIGATRTSDGYIYDDGITASNAKAPESIVIVGLNEAIYRHHHVNLAPRDSIARLIDAISKGAPSVIALDVSLDGFIDGDARPQNGVDAQLRRAIVAARRRGVIVLLNQIAFDSEDRNAAMPISGNVSLHESTLPFFARAASGVGNVDFEADADGICRHLPLSSAARPSLPLLAARWFKARQKQALSPALLARLNRERTPIDFIGGPGAINILPADKILQTPALALLLGGKIVFIGGTFPRLYDYINSPYDLQTGAPSATKTKNQSGRRMYGVEMLAQSTATILRAAPRHSHDSGRINWQSALIAFLGALIVTMAASRGAMSGIATACVLGIGFLALAFTSSRAPLSWAGAHYWPASKPLLAAIFACGWTTAYRQISIARELKLVRGAFAMHVGEEVLHEMGGKMPELGGETRDIAILFCDIEGFSALSETMRDDPQRLMTTLNEHFEPLVNELKSRRAYVDNYVGDLVMALFGAPALSSLDGHNVQNMQSARNAQNARNAVWAAINFIDIIHARNQERCASGAPAIEVGIGVHCGPAVVGNMGSSRRIHYTAIGDAVNIASRVESATRQFHTPLLVTEETVRCFENAELTLPIAERIEWEFVADTTVKGRVAPVRLYRPHLWGDALQGLADCQ